MRVTRRRLLTSLAAPFIIPRRALAIPRGSITADPIAAVLAGMVSGQWMKITGASQGLLGAAQQPKTLTEWDPGGEGSPVTWANDAAVSIGGSGGPYHGIFPFSAGTVREDGTVIQWGGGHTNSGDNSVVQFSAKSACQAILGQGGSQNWKMLIPGGFYIPQAYPRPSGSLQNETGNSTSFQTTATYSSGTGTVSAASIPTQAVLTGNSAGQSTITFTGAPIGGVGYTIVNLTNPGSIQSGTTVSFISGGGPYTVTLSQPITGSGISNGDIVTFIVGWRAGGADPFTGDIPALTTITGVSGLGPYTISLSNNTLNGGTSQPFGASLNVFWAHTNKNGQLRTHSAHSYWWCVALGLTGKWSITGTFGWSPIGDSGPGANQEIIGDDGSSFFTGTLSPAFQGYALGGVPLWCNLDSKVYVWQQNGTAQHLYQIANPTTNTPTINDLGAKGTGTDNATQTPPVLTQYPDSSHRAIFAYRPSVSSTTFELLTDITGSPTANSYTFGSVPTFAGSSGGPAWCDDPLRSRMVRFDGSKQLAFVTLTGSPASATFTLESAGSVSGDTPSVADFARITYLPIQDAYVATGNGDVWLRKP